MRVVISSPVLDAVAERAVARGADVVLVSGPTALAAPAGVRLVGVRTTREMRDAVLAELPETDLVVMAAAPADYRPAAPSARKIKKSAPRMTLELERTEDILKELGEKKGDRILIGFAAETEDLVTNAKKKLREKNLDFIVVNDVTQPGTGFSSDTNQVKIIYPSGKTRDLPLMSKEEVSQVILNEVVGLLERRKKQKK